jgi:hypothetical protein
MTSNLNGCLIKGGFKIIHRNSSFPLQREKMERFQFKQDLFINLISLLS